MIKCINRNGPLEGEGKPEALKGNFKGYYSRRINFEHRLVYKVHDSEIIIVSVNIIILNNLLWSLQQIDIFEFKERTEIIFLKIYFVVPPRQ